MLTTISTLNRARDEPVYQEHFSQNTRILPYLFTENEALRVFYRIAMPRTFLFTVVC